MEIPDVLSRRNILLKNDWLKLSHLTLPVFTETRVYRKSVKFTTNNHHGFAVSEVICKQHKMSSFPETCFSFFLQNGNYWVCIEDRMCLRILGRHCSVRYSKSNDMLRENYKYALIANCAARSDHSFEICATLCNYPRTLKHLDLCPILV